MMSKKIILVLTSILLLTIACRQQQTQFTTRTIQDKRCLEKVFNETLPIIEDNRWQVENKYSIQWPDKGCLSTELERVLIQHIFADTTARTIEDAAEQFLNETWQDDEETLSIRTIDSISVTSYSYALITGTCLIDDNLATFTINKEFYTVGAAHGYYMTDNVTIDLNTQKIIHLEDLIDTAELGEILIRALEDLVVNREDGNTTDCLFDEYKERLPLPDCFFIDSTRSVITAVYNPYSVQPYCCGMLFVKMPVFWLSKHTPLTPYAKEIFGPDAYLPTETD